MKRIRIGTRGSSLARWQAGFIQQCLEKIYPSVTFEIKIIKTEGDTDQTSSLTAIGGQGVFTKAIEQALLDMEIDVAIHSLKDLPSGMAQGLTLGAVPERGPVEDVLITRKGLCWQDLKNGGKVASGSIRRRSQLLSRRPDLILTDLRGNIDTRIKKLYTSDLDAIIMAKAALVRLELTDVKYQPFTIEEMLPAIGQGAIGVQARANDREILDLVSGINHAPTFTAITAERMLLKTLDSGCQFPVGGHAEVQNDRLTVRGFVGSEDGATTLIEKVESNTDNPGEAGRKLAEILIDRGALTILGNNE